MEEIVGCCATNLYTCEQGLSRIWTDITETYSTLDQEKCEILADDVRLFLMSQGKQEFQISFSLKS